jgi:hypothetical protein
MEKMSVDEFLQTRVQPELQPVVEMIRGMMKAYAPQAQEMISYGIPAYKIRKIVAVISPTQKDITFSFSRGAQFEDPYGLLRGAGKSSRHVKLKSLEGMDQDALRYYIGQAVEMDKK